MEPQTFAALVQLGVAGVFLYAFLADKLRTKAAVDEAQRVSEARLAEQREMYEARLREEREVRGQWRALALGSEQRLDRAVPVVAAAVGAPVPSEAPQAAR